MNAFFKSQKQAILFYKLEGCPGEGGYHTMQVPLQNPAVAEMLQISFDERSDLIELPPHSPLKARIFKLQDSDD